MGVAVASVDAFPRQGEKGAGARADGSGVRSRVGVQVGRTAWLGRSDGTQPREHSGQGRRDGEPADQLSGQVGVKPTMRSWSGGGCEVTGARLGSRIATARDHYPPGEWSGRLLVTGRQI